MALFGGDNTGLDIVIRAKDQATKTFKKVEGQLMSMSGRLDAVGTQMKSTGRSMTMGLTAPIVAGVGAAVYQFSRFEDAMVEVQKVTDKTTADKLAVSIKDMSETIPIAREELAGIAADAARFGIKGVENIESFTDAVAKMSVATNLSATEAGSAFAKLATLTETPIEEISNLGSAINELSNNAAASSSEIVDSMLRGSAALSNFGLRNTEIVAVSGALNEVSASSERAGTRLRRLGQELMDPKRIDAIASSLGVTAQQFKAMRRESPIEVIRMLSEEFKNNTGVAENLRGVLSTVSTQVLAGLGKNFDGLNEALDISSDAFSKNVSLANEFEAASKTLSAQVTTMMNALKNAGDVIAEALADEIEWLVNKIEDLAQAFQNASPAFQKTVLIIGGLLAALGPVIWALGSFLTSFKSVIGVVKTASTVLGGLGITLSGPVIAAILAVIGAVALVIKYWDDIVGHPFIKEMWSILQTAISETIDAVNRMWSSLKSIFNIADGSLEPVLRSLAQAIGGILLAAVTTLAATVWAVAESFAYTVEQGERFLKWIGLVNDRSGRANVTLNNVGNSASRLFDETKKVNPELQRAADKLYGVSDGSEKLNEEINKTPENASAAGAAVANAGEKMQDALSKVSDKVKSTREEILGLYDEASDRAKNFKQKQQSAEEDFRNKVVNIVAGAQTEIKSLEDEVDDARESGNTERVSRLRKEIREKRDVLATYKDWEINLEKQIAERRKVMRMNELERAKYEFERKKLLNQREFLQKQKTTLEKILLAKQEHDRLVELKKDETALIKEFERSATATFKSELEKRQEEINKFTTKSIEQYNRIESAARSAARAGERASSTSSRSRSIFSFQHGGVVPTPKGVPTPIIAHGQERIVPANRSSKGGGGSVFNVNINNPVVQDRNDVDVVKKQIDRALRGLARDHKLETI